MICETADGKTFESIDENPMSKSCLYPGCKKKVYSIAFHKTPLCREHFDLSQWISYVLYKSEVVTREKFR